MAISDDLVDLITLLIEDRVDKAIVAYHENPEAAVAAARKRIEDRSAEREQGHGG
jgi:hypothetical protein